MQWKERFLTLGIAIVLVMFVFYGIFTFVEKPEYNDFCEERFYGQITTQANCESIEGAKWNEYREPQPKRIDNEEPITGYCDVQYQCNKEFREANSDYNQKVFFVSLVLGGISLITGFIIAAETVGSGMMLGGLVMMVIGTIRYWTDLANGWKFAILGIVLAILIMLGVKTGKKTLVQRIREKVRL